MSQTDRKHVQTELTENEYESFQEIATERGMTVKEAGHEALVRWVERQRRPDPTDRAFAVLDELDTVPLPSTAATDARQELEIEYIVTYDGHYDCFDVTTLPYRD